VLIPAVYVVSIVYFLVILHALLCIAMQCSASTADATITFSFSLAGSLPL